MPATRGILTLGDISPLATRALKWHHIAYQQITATNTAYI